MAGRMLLAAAAAGPAAAQPLPGGESTHTVSFGPRSSPVVVHNYAAEGRASAVVVALHGWHGSASGLFSICRTGKIGAHARTHGFIGVCPEGDGGWNAAGCCGDPVSRGTDDVGFIRAVVAWVKERQAVSRVYAVGLSNGAMLAWRLVCEASDVFDGVAPVAGGYFGAPPTFLVQAGVSIPNGWVTDSKPCTRSDYPWGSATQCWTPRAFHCNAPAAGYPLLHVHGTSDHEEPFELVVAQFDFFAAGVLGCSGRVQTHTQGRATCYEYSDCGHRPALCTVQGMGHQMPGSVYGFDAVEAAWHYWHGGWGGANMTRGASA